MLNEFFKFGSGNETGYGVILKETDKAVYAVAGWSFTGSPVLTDFHVWIPKSIFKFAKEDWGFQWELPLWFVRKWKVTWVPNDDREVLIK